MAPALSILKSQISILNAYRSEEYILWMYSIAKRGLLRPKTNIYIPKLDGPSATRPTT